jgi:hypothetical protein
MHAKRTIAEPARLLTTPEVAHRVCSYFDCDHQPYLAITEKVV